MKKLLISLLVLTTFSTLFYGFTYAHPGRTDKRGCHTCKTNCKKWGLKYGQYHCHKKK
ncbi:MAG: YHYH domain-containing protein [bacterium]